MRLIRALNIAFFAAIIIFSAGSASDQPGDKIMISRFFLEVVDGDTIIYKGTRMRFLGVDTPETKNPDNGFYRDQPRRPFPVPYSTAPSGSMAIKIIHSRALSIIISFHCRIYNFSLSLEHAGDAA